MPVSQAFVREPDGDLPEDWPELPLSAYPNYVTPRGLALLQERFQQNEARQAVLVDEQLDAKRQRSLLAREGRWLQARIASALLVKPQEAVPEKVVFACVILLRDEDGKEYCYRIVGEDEADPEAGAISWVSPLARALQGCEVGDEVIWPRPAGDLRVQILRIESGLE
jgi:transcription elongation factor GreB